MRKWLLSGNSNVTYLVEKHLLDKKAHQVNDGYIKKYLDLYSMESKMWGNGLYGPKWISSTYTLLDLVNLDVKPNNETKEAYDYLRNNIVDKYTLNINDKKTLDLCIVGMLIKIGSHLFASEESHEELIDYVLHTVNKDGAWNCYFNYRPYKTSSLHTTINVLEGLSKYKDMYTYRLDEVLEVIKSGNEFLLSKKMFRSRRTGKIIHDDFTKIHYPTRWKYDYIRAMEYFAISNHPYDTRMDESLQMMKKLLNTGKVLKGKTYTGRTHFNLDLEDYKRINTVRVLRVLKQYDYKYYTSMMDY